MTIAIQCWLAVRLDILGNVLILGIGLFAAGLRTSVDPSKVGVVLSYTLGCESCSKILRLTTRHDNVHLLSNPGIL